LPDSISHLKDPHAKPAPSSPALIPSASPGEAHRRAVRWARFGPRISPSHGGPATDPLTDNPERLVAEVESFLR